MTGPRPPRPADPPLSTPQPAMPPSAIPPPAIPPPAAPPPAAPQQAPPDWFLRARSAGRPQPASRGGWAGSAPGAMFPAAEDATALIQRISTESSRTADAGPGADARRPADAGSAGPADSAASGMRTATTAGVVRAGTLMAVATVVSRVTGLLSKIAILGILGVNLNSTAYTVANTLPNIVFELLIGGVLTSVAIPLLTRAQRSDADGGLEYTQRLLTIAVVGLLAATVFAVLCAPLLAHLYLPPGQAGNAQLTDLTTRLGRFLLPQIFFYGIAALFGAILNTKERFAANAWAPVLNNVVVIGVAAVLWFGRFAPGPMSRSETLILGIGTTAGIVLQAVVMIPSLLRSGFTFRWRWGWDARLTEAGGLVGWAVVYVLISQVGVVVTTNVAHNHSAGGYTVFSYASLLFQMPYGILGVAVLTAIMPRLSRHAAAGQLAEVKNDVSLANRLSAVALLPVSAALVVLGSGLAVALFEWGHVTLDEARQIGLTISAMAIGLVPLAMTLVQMRVFYAMKDGRTPTVINAVMVAVRVPLLLSAVLLRPDWVIPGLALATAVSYLIGAVVGELWLRFRFGPMGTARTLTTVAKMFLASAGGGGAAYLAVTSTVGITPTGVLDAVKILLIGGAVGLAVVAGLAAALRVRELQPVLARLQRLARRTPQPARAESTARPPDGMGGSPERGSTSPPSVPSREQVPRAVTHADAERSRSTPGGAPADSTTTPAPDAPPAAAGGPFVELSPGATVGGRYRLVNLVAVDDAGNRFWRAKDTVLPRDMAVTLLPDGNATSATVARTLRVGRLHHIGLPQTLDVGTEQGQSYVVGQWVDGATLTDLLAGGPLEPQVATSITAKVSEAVAEAHRNGIALGAINPSLVRVNFDGQVRLSHVIAHGSATPDQDIRAVGGLLYLMLTGLWPLPGTAASSPAGAGQLTPAPTRLGREVPAIDVRPGIPTALSALAERALHPDDPAGIHAVGAIAALLRQPETTGAAPPADQQEPVRPPLNPAERRLVKERRAKLAIASVMIAAFSALIIIVVASLAKQVMDGVAGPTVTGVPKLSAPDVPVSKPVVAPRITARPTTSAPTPRSGTSTSPSPSPSTTAPPPATVQKIVGATVYDPMGDGVKDNIDQVPQAFDGSAQSFWSTFVYKQQFPSALKPGVGLTLEFAGPITPTSVTVTSDTPPTTIEIRSAAGPDLPYTQTTPIGQGTIATGSNGSPGSTTISLVNAPKAKYLVVFVVGMAPDGQRFRSDVNEITVSGSTS